MKVKNIYMFKQDDSCFEKNNLPSETVPDQALSLNDILTRFTRGQAPNVAKEGTFSDVDLDDASQSLVEGIDPLTELDYSRARVAYLEATYKDEIRQAELDEKARLLAETKKIEETKTD